MEDAHVGHFEDCLQTLDKRPGKICGASDRNYFRRFSDDPNDFDVRGCISDQTFYTFIIENIDKFGALKAIGAESSELIAMIPCQATFMALTGYGLGIGICAIVIWIAQMRIPDYAAIVTYNNMAFDLCHSGHYRRNLQLHWRARGAPHRTL